MSFLPSDLHVLYILLHIREQKREGAPGGLFPAMNAYGFAAGSDPGAVDDAEVCFA
jgi:hypothetical protein